MNVSEYDSPDIMFLLMKQSLEDEYEPKEMYEKGLFNPQTNCEQPFNMGSVYDYMEKPCMPPYENMCNATPYQSMYDMDMPYYKEPEMDMRELIEEVKACAMTCHEMMNYLIERDCDKRRQQIKYLYDCSRICDEQVVYLITNSRFSKHHARLCAMICKACGEECSKYPDMASKHCARVCLSCANSCMEYAGM